MIKKFKLFEYISHYRSIMGEFHLSNELEITEEDSEQIYNQVANFYKENSRLSFLGSGSFGSAFSLDDKVLKITTDKNEVDNIEYLRKKNFAGIVSYYDIRKINLSINGRPSREKNLYSIIMDKVQPLNEIETECYKILYKFGYVDGQNHKLHFTYTLDYDNLYENSAKHFKKLNDGSRIKKIIEILINADDWRDVHTKMREELDIYSFDFEYVELEDIQANIEEFEKIILRFYNDILELLCDIIRCKLILYDSHEQNVGKDEEGHFKMIDLGFKTNYSGIKLKLKPIDININLIGSEKFIMLISDDGEHFKYNGTYDTEEEAIDDIDGDIEEKYIKIKGETILILYNNRHSYRIISNQEYPEIAAKNSWEIKDPDQLSLKLWNSKKS